MLDAVSFEARLLCCFFCMLGLRGVLNAVSLHACLFCFLFELRDLRTALFAIAIEACLLSLGQCFRRFVLAVILLVAGRF